jgi:ATP-binding cassette subfamily E protein 1
MISKRLAIVDPDKCRPNKCNKECKKICVVERIGKRCIDIEEVAKISEITCIGCGQCTSSSGCPFSALSIINIPSGVGGTIVHRFGLNGFRLYKLPTLKMGSIMGIIGENGVGKSTVIKLLSNSIQPNFEEFGEFSKDNKMPDTKEIIKRFRGNEIQKYLDKLYQNKLDISVKPQQIEMELTRLKIKKVNPTVKEYINKKLEKELLDLEYKKTIDDKLELYDLTELFESPILKVSGGELQRILCFITAFKKADVYIFDEPSNYLDIKKRLQIAYLISSLVQFDKTIIVIEHDLAILDYVSDYVTIMFGQPSAYGVTSMSYTTGVGINSYFDGFIKQENMRFRETAYDFKELTITDSDIKTANTTFDYDEGTVEYPNFKLQIKKGSFPSNSSILVVLGENGTGKTTFLNYLKEKLSFTISYKPQYLDCNTFMNSDGTYPTVDELFNEKIRSQYHNDLFKSDVVKPLLISKIADRKIDELSGGELQRMWIVYCLGTNAQIYLLDEPSSNLDVEMRIRVTKIIKRFILHNSKIGFIVEHDIMMATSLAQEMNSRIIVFEKLESEKKDLRCSLANEPSEFKIGINKFLGSLGITIRTESEFGKHNRPRINKMNSAKDREQKKNGTYYL